MASQTHFIYAINLIEERSDSMPGYMISILLPSRKAVISISDNRRVQTASVRDSRAHG